MAIEFLPKKPLKDMHYIVLDTETTNYPITSQHEIIEIACIKIEGSKTTNIKYHSLVKPPCNIQKINFDVSGISDQMVEHSPSIDVILPDLLKFIGDDVLVGQNISFDIRAINHALTRCGYSSLANISLCTSKISKKLFPKETAHNMDALLERFGIEKMHGRHRAQTDVILTSAIFLKMIPMLLEWNIGTIEKVLNLINSTKKIESFQQITLF